MKDFRTYGGAFGLDDGRQDDLAYVVEQDSKILALSSSNFGLLKE